VMMWGAISYAEKLNWCTSRATLAPLDTKMFNYLMFIVLRWHHFKVNICCAHH
jgi:hypothetical protein